MSIYKPCDIRGSAEKDLTPELYRSWGRVLGTMALGNGPVLAGGDVRQSTREFLGALVDGICQSGVETINLEQLPTPMIYFAKRHLAAAACAIVTASHNPAEINGLKWMVADLPASQDEVDALRRGADSKAPESTVKNPCQPRVLDIEPDYLAWLKNSFQNRSASMRVVIDPMYGCWADRAAGYLRAVFPGLEITAIRDEPKPDFGGCMPDSAQPRLLEDLCAETKQQNADLGIAFDGDGDRVSFVDSDGSPLGPEQATQILLDSFADEIEGKPFVYDLKFSDQVPRKAQSLGAEPIVERSGHAFIRTRMIHTSAIFGAETSGHYFFGSLDGGDDGLFTACWMIDYLARSRSRLSELHRECPAVFLSPDLRVRIDGRERDEIIEFIGRAWADYPQSMVDGVRIVLPDGWALVRGSVTEPALTFRFEAESREQLTSLVRRYCDALAGFKTMPELKDTLWERFQSFLQSAPEQ